MIKMLTLMPRGPGMSREEKLRRLSEDEEKFCDKQRTILFMLEEPDDDGGRE